MEGLVTTFDHHRGLGSIRGDQRDFPFHCTALLDGSREVAVGAAVAFALRPGGQGRWEATEIAKL